MRKVYDNFIKRYVAVIMILSICIIVLVDSERYAKAVSNGIGMCVGSVIPSLFPILFLSQYLIKSGGAEEVGKLFGKPTEILFGLPGVCGVTILTGLFGGFPAGARAAETLTQNGIINRKQGQRLATIAFSSGPGFTIGMIGAELYKNKSAGLLILTAQIVSCIILGIGLKISEGRELNASSTYEKQSEAEQSGRADAFVESAADTASTIIAMCSFIIVFQVMSAMLDAVGIISFVSVMLSKIGFEQYGKYLIPCVMEVTGGSVVSVNIGLPFTAFVVGFGGLSVHFQNFAICREIHLNKLKYIGVRFVQGLICSLFVNLALKIPYFAEMCEPTSAVFNAEYGAHFSRISYSFGVIMLIMCLMSVLCLPESIRKHTDTLRH